MIRRCRSIVQHNFPAKLVALGIAIILWAFVMNDQNPLIEGNFKVKLVVTNAPLDCQVTYETKVVEVKVKAPRDMFVNVDDDSFSAYLDLNNMGTGNQKCRVHAVMPQGFELLELAPDYVDVLIDPIEQKTMPVEMIVSGTTAPGTTVADIDQPIKIVTVEGPHTLLQRASRIICYVGLSGNSADFTTDVPLLVIDDESKQMYGLKVIPESVEVGVQLARGLSKKVVDIRPITANDLPEAYEITAIKCEPEKIEVAGKAGLIDKVISVETEPISLSDVSKDTDKVAVLRLPEGVTVTDNEVKVHIEVKAKRNAAAGPQSQR